MLGDAALKRIERKAKNDDIKKIISFLNVHLGAKLTAYLSGKSDALVVDRWMRVTDIPNPVETLRLRYAFEAVAMVVEEYDAETAISMFLGMNRVLNDEAPASWLRDHEKEEDLREVVLAAKSLGEMGA